MFLWVSLPENVDADELLAEAIRQRLLFVPGRGFCADGSGTCAARLNFASPTHEEIEEGVALLGNLIRRYGHLT
jgi:2-aminoadipate transaminase